jgi:hypothetical protein
VGLAPAGGSPGNKWGVMTAELDHGCRAALIMGTQGELGQLGRAAGVRPANTRENRLWAKTEGCPKSSA